MARDSNFYIDRANARFEAGFTTIAAQKEALRDLASAHELLTQSIRNLVLAIDRDARSDAQMDVYWNMADLHNWKAKHSELAVSVFPEAKIYVEQIEALVDLRKVIKSAEIVRVERREHAKVAEVTRTIRDIMETNKAHYARGLELNKIFKGLPIYANVHYVVNQFGTEFLRAFYYMDGILTPLNVIIAVFEAKQTEEIK